MNDIITMIEKFMGALRVLLSYEDFPSDIKKSMGTILAWAAAGEYGMEKSESDLFPSIPMLVTDEQLNKMIEEDEEINKSDDDDDDDDDKWEWG